MYKRILTKSLLLTFKVFIASIFLFGISKNAQAQFIVAPSVSPSQICQCDTITVTFIVTPDFYTAGNTMRVELSNQLFNFTGSFIELAPLPFATPHGNTGTIQAVIPCTLAQGSYRIRVLASSPTDTSLASPTLIVGRTPDVGLSLSGGFTAQNFIGFTQYFFCEGDTVELSVTGHEPGNSYVWQQNGVDISGATGLDYKATESGNYRVRVTQGFCESFSKDTLIIAYSPIPLVAKTASSPGVTFGPDTLFFCIGDTVTLRSLGPFGNAFVNTGLPSSYQWLTDSLDNFGQPVIYPLEDDTLQDLRITEPGVYWVTYSDGQCSDTSRPYYVFMDSIPATDVLFPNGLTC